MGLLRCALVGVVRNLGEGTMRMSRSKRHDNIGGGRNLVVNIDFSQNNEVRTSCTTKINPLIEIIPTI